MSDHDFQQRPTRSMRSMGSINDAIDIAVRDMMHVDPRPGLRRRVLSNLDAPVRKRSWMPWLLAPAGALAAVVLAVALVDDRTTSPGPVTTRMTSGATAPAGPPPPAAGIPARTREAPAQSPRDQAAMTAHIFGPRTTRVSAASVRLFSADEHPASMGEISSALSAAQGEAGIPPALVIHALEIQPLQLPALLPRR